MTGVKVNIVGIIAREMIVYLQKHSKENLLLLKLFEQYCIEICDKAYETGQLTDWLLL